MHDSEQAVFRGAYHLTEKSGWGVESIMVSDLPVYRRIFHIRYGLNPEKGEYCVSWVWNRERIEKLVNGKHIQFFWGSQVY